MANKYFKVFIFLFLIIVVFYFLIKYNVRQEIKPFRKITIDKNYNIQNYTNKKFLDTIVAVGLKNLKINDVKIFIHPLQKEMKGVLDENYILKAHVRGIGNFYYIWVDDMSKLEYIETLAHELVHVQQYNSKKLIYDDGGIMYWEGKKFDLKNIQYQDRPWEIEAFGKEQQIKQMMLLDLY